MKRIRKITVLSLLLAIVFFSSGTCVFTMNMAQAAEMNMSDMSLSLDEDASQNVHCLKKTGADCEVVQNQHGSNGCSLSCGNSISKTAVVKKAQDSIGLSVLNVPPQFFLGEQQDTQPASAALEKKGNQEEILLSVAKKE